MIPHARYLLLPLAMAASLLAAGPACAASSKPVSGTVVAADSGQALPGAVVLVRWFRIQSDLAHSREVCYHVESAITDGQGRFRTAKWREGWRWGDPYDVRLSAFKPGYLFDPRANWRPERLSLVRFSGSADEYATRIEELRRLEGDCHEPGPSKRNIQPWMDALAAEAQAFPFVARPVVCKGCAPHVKIEAPATK